MPNWLVSNALLTCSEQVATCGDDQGLLEGTPPMTHDATTENTHSLYYRVYSQAPGPWLGWTNSRWVVLGISPTPGNARDFADLRSRTRGGCAIVCTRYVPVSTHTSK